MDVLPTRTPGHERAWSRRIDPRVSPRPRTPSLPALILRPFTVGTSPVRDAVLTVDTALASSTLATPCEPQDHRRPRWNPTKDLARQQELARAPPPLGPEQRGRPRGPSPAWRVLALSQRRRTREEERGGRRAAARSYLGPLDLINALSGPHPSTVRMYMYLCTLTVGREMEVSG